MGQKANPIGLRLGINRTWDSRWFAARQEYAKLLHQDLKIRKVLKEKLKAAVPFGLGQAPNHHVEFALDLVMGEYLFLAHVYPYVSIEVADAPRFREFV